MYKRKNNILLIWPDEKLKGEVQTIVSKRGSESEVLLTHTLNLEIIDKEEVKLVLINEISYEKVEKVLLALKEYEKKSIQVIGIFDEALRRQTEGFKKLGIHDWIIKPYLIEELENRVVHYMDYIDMCSKSEHNQVLFNALLHNVPYMSWFKNKDSQYMTVNNKLCEHAGKEYKIISGRDDLFVWDGKIGKQCREYDLKVMNERRHVAFNELIPGTRGDRLFEVHKAPVINGYNEVIGTVGVARDITEESKAQEQIEKMAYTDDLTQVRNRRGFYHYMEQIRLQNRTNITLFYMDLDNFKAINDSYGHYYGDKALVELTHNLKNTCKESIISRLGGDEFVIVFEQSLTRKEAKEKAHKLIEATQRTYAKGQKQHTVSTSIGIVQEDFSQSTIEELLTKGDRALYKAKENGKSQYVFYTAQLEKEYQFMIEIEKAIQKAILKEELVLYYQPQYTINEKLIGFEALLRWENENYKAVPIIKVIEIIEAKNLIHEVGDYIFKKAFTFTKAINEQFEEPMIISVNISALQLMKEDFVDGIKKIIEAIGVVPKHIAIEITETVLLENMDENIEKIKALKELGIIISLDDFGTGYSSLNYVSKLPLCEIKIDKSFIQRINLSNTHKYTIQTIIQMAHLMDLRVVAEGVENEHQLQVLKELEVDYIQGYLLGKPMKEMECMSMLN